jgi:hypothetical protein
MESSTSSHASFDRGRRVAALWAGLLAGPLVWAAQLQTNYVLSYVACEQRHTWMLHLSTALALLLIATAAFLAWRAAPPLGQDEHRASDVDRAAVLRARFMALGGLALCAWFALVVVATEIPALVLHPCSW